MKKCVEYEIRVGRAVLMVAAVITFLMVSTVGASQVPGPTFEVASIRPNTPAPPTPGGRGGGANAATCGGSQLQIDPRRFVVKGTNLYELITMAYTTWAEPKGGCAGVNAADLLSGGPGWVRSALWDIQALIPEGAPPHTRQEFWDGKAPELQAMLQKLLTDRFKLVLRRVTKEMPVYLLTVAKGGPKFNGQPPSERMVMADADGKILRGNDIKGMSQMELGREPNGARFTKFVGWNMTMDQLANAVSINRTGERRPVVDRTNLRGEFNFIVEYAMPDRMLSGMVNAGISVTAAGRPSFETALEQQIGLRLEEGKASVEVWVIDQAEKPSEN